MAEGKFPKKPNYGKIIEICKKDFRNFKKDHENRLINIFNTQIRRVNRLKMPNNELFTQKERLKSVKELINEGKEDIAFSIFFRTFPSCLPYRSK
jgi:hypothetical protein